MLPATVATQATGPARLGWRELQFGRTASLELTHRSRLPLSLLSGGVDERQVGFAGWTFPSVAAPLRRFLAGL